MSQSARTRDGRAIDAAAYGSADWEALKQSSELGEIVMPCCDAPAVLKTSINGLHFFAHLSDECATAPETKWHKAGKAAVLAALRPLGIEGREEVGERRRKARSGKPMSYSLYTAAASRLNCSAPISTCAISFGDKNAMRPQGWSAIGSSALRPSAR